MDRIAARIERWLSSSVRRYPDSSGGPAATVQVCADQKRHAGGVITVADLCADGDAVVAGQLAEAILDHAENVTNRGTTVYLYALNAAGTVLLGGFAVMVKPSDLPESGLTVGAGASGAAPAATLPEAVAVARTATAMLTGERSYAAALAQQNLATLAASADALARLGDLQSATTQVLQQQSTALLDQLRAANDRAAAAEQRARELERELAASMKDHRATMELLGEALDSADKLKDQLTKRSEGPFAQAKAALIEQLVGGVSNAVLGKATEHVNGHAAAVDPADDPAAAEDLAERLKGATRGDA